MRRKKQMKGLAEALVRFDSELELAQLQHMSREQSIDEEEADARALFEEARDLFAQQRALEFARHWNECSEIRERYRATVDLLGAG